MSWFVSLALRHLVSFSTGFAAFSGSTAALATETCQVEVLGSTRETWLAVAEKLEAELRSSRLPSNCASVVVEITNTGARLIFMTLDGRRAERRIDDPIELIPSVQALSVTTPKESRPASTSIANSSATDSPAAEGGSAATQLSPSRRNPPARPPAAPQQSDEPFASKLAPNPYALSPVLSAHVGFRAGAESLISPLVGGTAALLLDRWELGLLGRYEAHYVNATGGNEGSPETSGAVLGVTLGRREPLGNFALRFGGSTLLAALHEDNGAKEGRAEVRLGVYASAVWPKRSRTRLRLDLGYELVPHNIGQSEQNALGASSLPWWAMTWTIGAEFG